MSKSGNFKAFVNRNRLIERHKNPWGMFFRIPTYLLLFRALWLNNIVLCIIALCIEMCLWFFVPPVARTFPFIHKIVENELLWLKAETGILKLISVFLLIAAVFTALTGLWMHWFFLIGASAISLVLFNLLMNVIARRESVKSSKKITAKAIA